MVVSSRSIALRLGVRLALAAAASAPLVAGCSAPLEIGGAATFGRRGLAWQARVAAHPLGWVRGSLDRDVDVGLGLARNGGADAAWLTYFQATTVAWRDRHPSDAATLVRSGAELHLDLTNRRFGGAALTRIDAAVFLDYRDDASAYWGEMSAGLSLAVAFGDPSGPTLSLGAHVRLPAGGTLAIPDGI